jgi:hypothetical protein
MRTSDPTLSAPVGADQILTPLMGDMLEPRRQFTEQNALGARNIDLRTSAGRSGLPHRILRVGTMQYRTLHNGYLRIDYLKSSYRRILGLAGGLVLALAVTGCATTPPAVVSTLSPNDGPWRTTADGADTRLALEGHDAVAYFTRNEAVRGDPAVNLQHAGVTWRFASAANRAEFERQPQK